MRYLRSPGVLTKLYQVEEHGRTLRQHLMQGTKTYNHQNHAKKNKPTSSPQEKNKPKKTMSNKKKNASGLKNVEVTIVPTHQASISRLRKGTVQHVPRTLGGREDGGTATQRGLGLFEVFLGAEEVGGVAKGGRLGVAGVFCFWSKGSGLELAALEMKAYQLERRSMSDKKSFSHTINYSLDVLENWLFRLRFHWFLLPFVWKKHMKPHPPVPLRFQIPPVRCSLGAASGLGVSTRKNFNKSPMGLRPRCGNQKSDSSSSDAIG